MHFYVIRKPQKYKCGTFNRAALKCAATIYIFFLLKVQVNLDLKNVHNSHSLIFKIFFNQDSYLGVIQDISNH